MVCSDVPFMIEIRIRVEMQLYKLISKTYTYTKLADLDGLIFCVSKHLLYLRKPHYPHGHTHVITLKTNFIFMTFCI